MFDIIVTDEQLEYARNLCANHNFGQRGRGDGTPEEQLTGMIGQTAFADALGAPRPRPAAGGFDGGFDFTVNGKKVDLKTMGRNVPLKPDYVHNFTAYQRNDDVDFYLFASYNKRSRHLTIGGCVSKTEFTDLAEYYPIGAERFRDDGTSFENTKPNYEILQSDLRQADSLGELIQKIN